MSEENINNSQEEGGENQNQAEEKAHISSDGSALFGSGDGNAQPPKPPKKVTLTTFVCTCVALVLAAVMLTYTLCNSAYQARLAEVRLQASQNDGATSELAYELEVLAKIFETYSFEELDEEQIKTELLKAYVRATGDKYAEYYTDAEYAALTAEMAGESQGIGINIINATVDIGGVEYKALKVINVIKDSPAMSAGVAFGDYIIAAGNMQEDRYETVSSLGYDMALKKLQGVKDTVAEFVVYREGSSQPYIDFSILRAEFTTSSVMSVKADADVSENTGVIKIVEFDRTTPAQLSEAIESLKTQGCDKFVFDVRYNPGGELSSIVAVLSFFLDEGDTVISVKDNAGNETVTTVAPVESEYGCSVKAEDIGKYKDLDMVVLCNESTASAAELFVANFRDHGLGAIIGTKTYGKGSMQSYIDLSYFGCEGVLKITRNMYYPPSGVSYDGEGIEPTYTVGMSDEAKKVSIYETMGKATDNQLLEAVKHF